MPVVWLTWSILLFLLCIMLFVWRAGPRAAEPLPVPSDGDLIAARIMLTLLLVLGINYGILVLATFSRYGEAMDKAWKRRIDGWLEEQSRLPSLPPVPPPFPPAQFNNYTPNSHSASYPDPRQEQFTSPYTMPRPTMSPQSPPEPDDDRASDQSRPPSYISGLDLGFGYTSDEKRLYVSKHFYAYFRTLISLFDSNTYQTKRNTMLNKSVHSQPDDTTANPTQQDPPVVKPMPSHEAPSSTVRLVAPLELPPRFPVPPLNLTSSEDLSQREHEGNENQDSPHVRFRSPLASGRNINDEFSQSSDVDYPPGGHPDL